MGKRYWQKLAVLAKRETVYGTDAVPTGAANAMLMTDVNLTPLDGSEVSRDLLLPYLGWQGVVLVNNVARLEGSIEIAGAGAAGTAPAYATLLRACGFAEVLTAATSAVYSPVSGGFDAASIYFNRDGVQHILLGARGTVTFTLTPSQIPRMRFSLLGLLGTISDAALPTAVFTGFQPPMIVSKANTVMTLHGWTAIAESLSIDMANQVEGRFLIGDESIELVDRQPKGTAVVQADSLATVNWFGRALARTRGSLSLVHGVGAGKIVQFDAPQVEVGRPAEGQSQKIVNYTLPLMLCTNTGNDELTITVK